MTVAHDHMGLVPMPRLAEHPDETGTNLVPSRWSFVLFFDRVLVHTPGQALHEATFLSLVPGPPVHRHLVDV